MPDVIRQIKKKGGIEMADDTKAKEPEQIVPAEPVPSSEPAKEAEPVDATDKATEVDLPEGVSERTKEQFNKLKEANQSLKEELAKKEKFEPIFDSMRPQTPAQGLTQGQLDQVTDTDPTTGERFINEQKLTTLLTNSTQKAEAAVAQVNRFIEDQQTREAFNAIPQLNPQDSKFDPDIHKATRAYILDSMMNPQDYNGRQLTYKEAGERAMKATNAEIAKVEKEANAQQTAKEQGSLEATGRSDKRVQTNTSEEELRHRIRSGDEDALASFFEEA
jgi:hypothetical protein